MSSSKRQIIGLTSNFDCGILSDMPLDAFHERLVEIGLVKVLLGSGLLGEGSVWWVGKATAEGLVASGKATLVPLPEKESCDSAN
jgi:hypothetical protein